MSQKRRLFGFWGLCILILCIPVAGYMIMRSPASPPIIDIGGPTSPGQSPASIGKANTDSKGAIPSEPVEKPLPAVSTSDVPGRGEVGLSVAETLTGLSADELNRQMDDFVALRVAWVRLDFDWAVIQRRDADTYDWTRIDRVVAAANKRQLQLLPILVYTPAWARGGGCDSSRCPPADPATFAHFASVAAERYAPQGLHTWEIWNEPNVAGFWRGGADTAHYARILKAANLAIKDIDPGAMILSGGLAIVATHSGSIAPREYLAALYKEGTGLYFDAVGFHPYSFPVTATYQAPWNAWQQMDNTLPSLRSIMIANGDRGKQIWITEYGAPTGGPGNASAAYVPNENTDHVTEERQKEMLIDAITDAGEHDWLGPFFWYSYKDIGVSRTTTENFYGLLRRDGSPKPAYDALRELLN